MSAAQQQQQRRKFVPCKFCHTTLVTFDNAHKNADGTKFVPLVEVSDSLGQKKLEPHNCPLRTKQNQQPVQHQQQGNRNSSNVEAVALLRQAIKLLEEG
jgi:hypothetical protein